MRKILLNKMLCLFAAIWLVAGCSDDPYYGNGYDSELNNLYSNKSSSQPGTGALNMTYSGSPFYGREAHFEMQTASTANIKFFNVFPGETETLVKGIQLTSTPDGYTFTGSAAGTKGTTFSYTGSVKDGFLAVALTDIKIPNYPFSNGGVFETKNYSVVTIQEEAGAGLNLTVTTPLKLDWISAANDGLDIIRTFMATEKLMQLSGQTVYADFGAILGKLIYLVLPRLTFHEDGSITAQYAGLNDGIDIMSLIAIPVTAANRAEVVTLPGNILFYYIDGNTLTIHLNIDGIVNYIATNQQAGDTTTDGSTGGLQLADMLDLIVELYPTITDWVQNGIKFNLAVNGSTELQDSIHLYNMPFNFFYTGNYQLYAGMSELQPIVRILPGLLMYLGEMGIIPTEIDIVGEKINLLEALIGWATYTTDFNLGLYLSY